MKRARNLPAGNWTPYVRWCIRRGLWLRGAALGVSVAGCVFFAVSLSLAIQDRAILGIDTFRGADGCDSGGDQRPLHVGGEVRVLSGAGPEDLLAAGEGV